MWELFPEKDDIALYTPNYLVTAKDIEEAPEWVKALEPVEVVCINALN